MKLNTEDQARLEQLIAAGLQQQPRLKAPEALQSRVFAEIARRAALPWYHHSFRGWPMLMQISFVFTALATVVLARSVILWSHPIHAASELAAPVTGRLTFVESMGSAWSAFASMFSAIGNAALHRVPGFWLVVGIGVAAAMYAVLAGIGVAVYRTLDSGKARA
jgi:uncharacterized membrane protein